MILRNMAKNTITHYYNVKITGGTPTEMKNVLLSDETGNFINILLT